ncbi:MAG: hypothetical protein IJJ33_20175 [Victivallales bacterium]|nr:hypothetical protein [Victivallales bacterium]
MPAVLINANPSFEEVGQGWSRPQWLSTGIEPTWDNTVAVHGERSLCFEMVPQRNLLFWQPFAWDRRASTLALKGWIREENLRGTSRPTVTVELVRQKDGKDVFSYVHAKPTGAIENGFREHAALVDIPDGVYALRLLLMAPKCGDGASGKVWFDAVTLTKVQKPDGKLEILKMSPGGTQGVYVTGEVPEIRLSCRSGRQERVAVALRCVVRNVDGRVVAEHQIFREWNPLEEFLECISLGRPCTEPGYYWVEGYLEENEVVQSKVQGGFVVTDARETRDPFFGFTGYGAPDKMLEAMAKLGAATCGYIFYPSSQNPQGTFHFEKNTAPLALRRKLGYRIVAGYNIQGSDHLRPAWLNDIAKRDAAVKGATRYSDDYIAAYRDFATALAQYARDKVDEVALIEEIDIAQHLTPLEHDSYLQIVQESAMAIHRVAPNLPVSSVGVASPDFNAKPPLRSMRHFWDKLGPYLDGISFDGYLEPNCFGKGYMTATPEKSGFRERMMEARKIAGDKMLAVDEAGWSILSDTPLDSPVWLDYAAVLQRTYILAKTIPCLRHYLYFKVINGPRQKDWLLFHEGGELPTPAAAAYGVVAHHLAFAQAPQEISLHRDIQAWSFRQENRTLLVLWSTSSSTCKLSWALPQATTGADFMGRKLQFPAGTVEMSLTGRPLYLWLDSPQKEVAQALSAGHYELPELQADFSRTSEGTATVALRNLTPQELAVTLQEDGRNLLLPVGRMVTIAVPMQPNHLVQATFLTKQHTYAYRRELPLEGIPMASKEPRDEGGQTERMASSTGGWTKALDGEQNLFPVDAAANRLWNGKTDLSAKVMLSHSIQGLRLVAVVMDDVAIRERTGARLWGTDSIQFAIHPGARSWNPQVSGWNGYTEKDWEFGLALTPDGAQLYCYQAPPASGKKDTLLKTTEIAFAVTPVGEHELRYDVTLPWNLLGMQGTSGEVFGFNLIVLDSDLPGQTCQYWLGLSPGIANGKQPEHFPRFILKR